MKKSLVWFKKHRIEGLLVLLVAVICSIFMLYYGTFGTDVDWLNQHSAFPDYFRRRFYATGQFFPSLALQLGGGENIYRDSYYGLYSPIYLFSYLLPFVKMSDYVIAVSMLNIAVSVVLMYRWLLSVEFSEKLSAWGACVYLFATPVIYHAYVHCMFVNYMPFLLLGLFGVKRHLEQKGSGLLIISTFLMIMTSFYFSIGGMVMLCLYAVHVYVKQQKDRIIGKELIKAGVQFVCCLLIAVLMSGVLLIPTAFVLQGRGSATEETWSIWELLIPQFDLNRFVYARNGLGLSTLGCVALAGGVFSKKKYNRILYWGLCLLLCIPLFCCLLNGGLYQKNKVFIPFIPVVIYAMVTYLKTEVQKEKHHISEIIPYLLVLGLVTYTLWDKYGFANLAKSTEKYILLDGILLLCFFLLYYWLKKPWILVVPSLLFMSGFSMIFHLSNEMITSADFVDQVTDNSLDALVEKISENDENWYRTEQIGNGKDNAATLNRIHGERQFITSNYTSTYDKNYLDFRTKIFDLEMPFRNAVMESVSRNPVFQSMMGVKYVLSKSKISGWKKVLEKEGYGMYRNPYAAPIIYGTTRCVSEEAYDTVSFPYTQTTFLNYAIVKKNEDAIQKTGRELELDQKVKLTEEKFTLKQAKNGKADITTLSNGYEVKAEEEEIVELPLKKRAEKDTIYFLRFFVKNLNQSEDMKITLEGAANKISDIHHEYYNKNTVFTYAVFAKEGEKTLELKLGKGHYQILSATAYSANMQQIRSDKLYQDIFEINWDGTKGDHIVGTLTASEDEKVITSIPFDEGFNVFVDGEEVDTEVVNKTFLGFDITEGEHDMVITYHAKGLYLGMIVSVIGSLLCIVICKKKSHLV